LDATSASPAASDGANGGNTHTFLAALLFSWQQFASPEQAGFDAAALEAARAHADQIESGAVMVISHGQAVAAWGAIDRKVELFSARKSLYSALWGIAEAKGKVNGNATLAEAGIDDLQPLTDAEKKARFVDLLHARSGVYHPSAYAPRDQEEALPARGSHAADTFWFYNNWDFNIAGAWLEKATGKPIGILFDEWIAKPVGMEDYRPSDVFTVLEPGASRWPAHTFRMSARDLGRFGLLWLNKGRWNGKQIVPAQWIERASAPASNTGTPGQGYAMMWWTYDAGSVDAQRYPNASKVRVLMARGSGGQVIALIPEADVVIVHVTDSDNGRRASGRDVWTLIDKILGARTAEAKAKPSLRAMQVEPFKSQKPAFVWPAAIALDQDAMNAVAGEYELRPGVNARVYVHDGRLYAFMPGRGEAELFASSKNDFFVRIDAGTRIRFEYGEDGKATRFVANTGGREIVGRRRQG
jgi:CubicO group peptidase (beta-lactamase class C family)